MVLGDELHTGGKALESNVLAKKIDFFKTLGEHVQITGNRIERAGAVQASNSATIYTVPANKLLFLFFFSYSSSNRGTATGRAFFMDIAGDRILEFTTTANTSISDIIMFRPMFLIRTGEAITLAKNNTNIDHEVNIHIVGYEVDKEISIQ